MTLSCQQGLMVDLLKKLVTNDTVFFDQKIKDIPQKIIKDISLEKRQLLRDHSTIFHTLAEKKYLSAKDIHELYREDSMTYSKSMKTIYRYIDILEKAGLIEYVGFRRLPNSRITENLYRRTALLYFSKEPVKWWELPEYKKYFEKKTEFLAQVKGTSTKDKKELRELIISYTEARDKYMNIQLKHIENNPELVKVLSELSIMEIKGIIGDIAVFEIFIKEPELIERIKKLK